MSRPVPRRLLACLGFFVLSFGTACVARPGVVSAPAAAAAREAYERARRTAFSPRRFKALFSGEVSPRAGALARGYLSVFWDGEALVWRASAPVAGTARGGALTRTGGAGGRAPFPGKLTDADAIGIVLGVADVPPGADAATSQGDLVRLSLEGEGRAALLDGTGRVVGLELPGGTAVRFEPGEGVPRRIEATSPEGRAILKLESYGAWPSGEGVPPLPEGG